MGTSLSEERAAEIDAVVELAFAHLSLEGLDDIFKPPLLNTPIEQTHLANPAFSGQLKSTARQFLREAKAKGFNAPLRLNIPKSRHTYRQASLLDVRDLVRYTALVFSMAECIERARVPKEARVVFSSRFVAVSPCFDKNYGHAEFRKRSDELTKSGLYRAKIYSDIANFFDRLNLHKLESVLIDIGCSRKAVRLLNEVLFHWSARNSYGLPVGCDASRILAEAMLINVDRTLLDEGVTFVRYVDDYRIFAGTHAEAHGHLALLSSALEDEGLFINGSKTKISSVDTERAESDQADPNRHSVRHGFEVIDEAHTEEVNQVVHVGYKTRIAKYYRKPGEEAIRRLRQNNVESLFIKVIGDEPDEEDLKEFVKTFIYGERRRADLLFRVIDRHIHMIAYLADALTKESGRFTPHEREALGEALVSRYDSLARSEYYRLCIARVMSHPDFVQEHTFTRWLSDLPITANPAFLKELIGFFGAGLSRSGIRDLVKISENYHASVLRVIVSYALENPNCLPAERRRWAVRWMQSSNDPLVRALCAPVVNGSGEAENGEFEAGD